MQIGALLLLLKGCDWDGMIWLYDVIIDIPLDFIKLIIGYALSGKAWELGFEQRVQKIFI